MRLKSSTSDPANEIEVNGELTSDPLTMANKLNIYFTSIKPVSNYNRDESRNYIMNAFASNENMNINSNELFKFERVNESYVQDLIRNLKNDSSDGFPEISVKLIKKSELVFSKILTKLINYCIDFSVFPEEWKVAW